MPAFQHSSKSTCNIRASKNQRQMYFITQNELLCIVYVGNPFIFNPRRFADGWMLHRWSDFHHFLFYGEITLSNTKSFAEFDSYSSSFQHQHSPPSTQSKQIRRIYAHRLAMARYASKSTNKINIKLGYWCSMKSGKCQI